MSRENMNCDYSTVFDIAKTADSTLSSTSLLLDRLIKSLNRGKLAAVEREIANLEHSRSALSAGTQRMRVVIEGIPKELAAIEENRKFRGTDVLFFGTSYVARQLSSDLKHWGVTRKKDRAVALIEANGQKSKEVQRKVYDLQDHLRKLEGMKNPSWWSRFILSVKAFFGAVSGFVAVACGDFVSGITSLVSAANNVSRLA